MKIFSGRRARLTISAISLALYVATAAFAICQAALPAKQSTEVSKLFTVITGVFGGTETEPAQVLGRTFTFDEFSALMRKFVGHFGLFAALGFFGHFALINAKKRSISVLINIFAAIGMAAVTEGVQFFTPGRAGLLSDVILDAQGSVMCVCALVSVRAFFHLSEREKDYSCLYAFIAFCMFTIVYLLCNDGSFYTQVCFFIYLAVGAVSCGAMAVAEYIL